MTEDIPSIKKDNVPKFKPTEGKNTFKVVDDKKKFQNLNLQRRKRKMCLK